MLKVLKVDCTESSTKNQRCNALFTWGRNDSWLCFVWRTLPVSTISLSLSFCFFHGDSMGWLKLNCLHHSTAFTPQSNLPSTSIFSLMVWSVCWHLGLERDILKCNACRKKENTEFYMVSNVFISHVKGLKRIDHRYIKEHIYFSKACWCQKKAKPYIVMKGHSQWLHSLIQSRSKFISKS